MAKIAGFRIQNYRCLKHIAIGCVPGTSDAEPLSNLTAFIGKNDTGKTALFDALGFLSDALKFGLDDALHMHDRGGYKELNTQGQNDAIGFDICYLSNDDELMLYTLSISAFASGTSFAVYESLSNGKSEFYDNLELQKIRESGKLGLSVIPNLKVPAHEKLLELCDMIAGWHINRFDANKARLPSNSSDVQQYLKVDCSNLANVVRYAEEASDTRLTAKNIQTMADNLQGVSLIDTEKTEDGRLRLRFHDAKISLNASQVSLGTLKFFAYQVLLNSATQVPLVCIEHPEANFHVKNYDALVKTLRSTDEEDKQVFISTHSSRLLDYLNPKDVWLLDRDNNGDIQATHVSEIAMIKNRVEEGFSSDEAWCSDYFDWDAD